jgi:trigger factor
VDITDAEVDEQLENLRTRNAPAVEEPDGTVIETGHILHIDFVGRIDGEPFEGRSGQDLEREVGSGRFLPGFEEQLVGATAGDDVEVNVTFPDPYGNAELAGRDAVFACHVAAVKKRQLPDLDDEFAKDVGDFENLDALRQRIRDDLVAARERESQQVLRKSLFDALIERTDFAVPAGMVESQLERQLRAAHQRLQGQVPEEAIGEQLSQWREQWREQAEREVREGLILGAIAEREKIEVEDAEVDAKIEELAAAQGVDAATLERAAGDSDLRRAMSAQLIDEKALAFLAGKAKVEGTTDS